MGFIVRLAKAGLIHCDFNEFNILIRDDTDGHEFDFVVIDFPQCVSIEHPDAKEYFDRDVQGIRDFSVKFRYNPQHDPTMFDTDGYGDGYKYAYPNFKRDVIREKSLDVEVQASGYAKRLETAKIRIWKRPFWECESRLTKMMIFLKLMMMKTLPPKVKKKTKKKRRRRRRRIV